MFVIKGKLREKKIKTAIRILRDITESELKDLLEALKQYRQADKVVEKMLKFEETK